ncbi:MAG: hypothetical protein PHC66_01450 [Candidatus Nanoarchaeia archaeon]|nr:hypothetical protein [Candidatus Nanoarchaeia archaeon]MDD5239176.1 hypothetical protein [Candidatus Nanoarchaeia archaeon]
MAELNIVTIGVVILAVLIAALTIAFVVEIYTEGTKATEGVNASELMEEAEGNLDSADNGFSVVEQLHDYKEF